MENIDKQYNNNYKKYITAATLDNPKNIAQPTIKVELIILLAALSKVAAVIYFLYLQLC